MKCATGLIGLLVCVACSAPAEPGDEAKREPRTNVVPASSVVAAVAAAAPAKEDAVTAGRAVPAPGAEAKRVAGEATSVASDVKRPTGASTLQVKRLVVTTGVKDREPLAYSDALPSDGTAIYAFVELANQAGESENVRVTFERKDGAERVGNVSLPVPGKVSRHRTWATTRFIRAPGVWEAVLWSENGSELGRTSFEVS